MGVVLKNFQTPITIIPLEPIIVRAASAPVSPVLEEGFTKNYLAAICRTT